MTHIRAPSATADTNKVVSVCLTDDFAAVALGKLETDTFVIAAVECGEAMQVHQKRSWKFESIGESRTRGGSAAARHCL